jgi:hypothetical protein
MTQQPSPYPDYDLIIAAIGETTDNLVMEFTTGYETDRCDIPIIQREMDSLIEVVRKQQESNSAIQQPGQQGITVGMVYAYESGLEEGKKGALTDLLENFRKINKEGNFRPWNIGHIEDVILEELRKAGVNR